MESSQLEQATNRVAHSPRIVALTFDDAPDDTWTPAVLDVLRLFQVKAMFFCLGQQIEQHQDVLRTMVGEGHEIGNHSWDHPYLTRLSTAEVEAQCRRTDEIIHTVMEERPRMFRPPYLDINADVLDTITTLGYRTVMVDSDSRDWSGISAREIEANILATVRPGAILLFHCALGNYQPTVEALPNIIRALQDDGYRIVSLSQLIGEPAYRSNLAAQ